jgi:hypothetical protein
LLHGVEHIDPCYYYVVQLPGFVKSAKTLSYLYLRAAVQLALTMNATDNTARLLRIWKINRFNIGSLAGEKPVECQRKIRKFVSYLYLCLFLPLSTLKQRFNIII